jgi:hypothetical protein
MTQRRQQSKREFAVSLIFLSMLRGPLWSEISSLALATAGLLDATRAGQQPPRVLASADLIIAPDA